ncbi:unnamed protein product, partial [Allacma fusca]
SEYGGCVSILDIDFNLGDDSNWSQVGGYEPGYDSFETGLVSADDADDATA